MTYFIILVLVYLAQVWTVGLFSLYAILVLISKLLFSAKLLGMSVKTSAIVTCEVVAIFGHFIFNWIFQKNIWWGYNVSTIILSVIIALIAIYLDNTVVFVEEEEQ